MKRKLIVFLGIMPWLPAYAGGPAVPDAVRPGAIRPGEERSYTIPKEQAEVFKVPKVVERPLDIDAGPKVQVTKFNLVGVVDRPAQKISISDVQELVDQKLAARPEGFTVGRLQEVATSVTQYYRKHGLILAQAFVPVQEVKDGVVNIRVMEGKLGRVVFEGNKKYSDAILEKPFESLIGQPVTKDGAEAALLYVNDYPGMGLFGVFQPGQQVGTADMVLKVQKEKRFDGSIRYDNHGLAETGVHRFRGELNINNITGHADKLTLSAQGTHVPDNLIFWAADYEVPVFGVKNTFAIGFNRNKYDVGGQSASQNFAGISENGHASLEHSFIRSRQLDLSALMRFERKTAITLRNKTDFNRDDLSVLSAQVNFDNVDTRFAGLNNGQIEFSHGLNDFLGSMGDSASANNESRGKQPDRRGASGKFAAGDFNKLFVAFSRLQSMAPLGELIKKPEWFKGQSLLLRAEAQWSSDLLVPLEQYAIGGPNNVRAYGPTQALFDKAMFFSFEYIIPFPGIADKEAFDNHTWGELIQLSFFYDVAFGRLNDPLPSEVASRNYKGAGLSISYNNPGKFSTKFTFANPIGDPFPQNKRSPQFWVDFNYYF